jgi:hypothetical protein
MKIHRSVQKLLVERARAHTHTQAGDLISLLSFLESRLQTFNTETIRAGVAQSVQSLIVDLTTGVRSPAEARSFASNLSPDQL